ncbi:Putative uncharacterized protein FLJ37770 [Eumeta japonica]|uniref:Histone-lysine N-methyltransferase SETMAR n=1 Tax=Eumeta variegata TaxID=151549 RepID=A0A4C1X3G7_EUMVA|nr:Putative uncharacterized protein FLJ37770 [Eumeta japonica]
MTVSKLKAGQEAESRAEIVGFHDKAPFLTTAYNCLNEFKFGHTNLTDDLRAGRPSTAATEDDISAVRLMIEIDKRVSYQQIRTSLGIGISQVYEILREYLAVRKLCTR